MYSWKPCMPCAKCQAGCRKSGHVKLISHGRHSHVAICMTFTGHLQIDVTERHSRPGAFFQACCLALEAMTQGSS